MPGLSIWDTCYMNLQRDLCVFSVLGVPCNCHVTSSPYSLVVDSIVNYNTENKVALINVDTYSGFSFYYSYVVVFLKIFLP